MGVFRGPSPRSKPFIPKRSGSEPKTRARPDLGHKASSLRTFATSTGTSSTFSYSARGSGVIPQHLAGALAGQFPFGHDHASIADRRTVALRLLNQARHTAWEVVH